MYRPFNALGKLVSRLFGKTKEPLSRRTIILGTVEGAGATAAGIAGRASLPRLLGRSSAPSAEGKTQLPSAGEAEARFKQLGLEVLDKKIVDGNSSNYLILLPDRVYGHNDDIAEVIRDLQCAGLTTGVGLGNIVGERGENLLEQTRAMYRAEDGEENPGYADGEDFVKFYGALLRQESGSVAYGNDRATHLRGVRASRIHMGLDVFKLEEQILQSIRGGRPSKDYQRDLQRLKEYLGRLGIDYAPEVFEKEDAWRSFRSRLDKILANIRHETGLTFIARMRPGDAVVRQVDGCPQIVREYRGNVFVLNPETKADNKQGLAQAYADARVEK
jgi:hypothetical protein